MGERGNWKLKLKVPLLIRQLMTETSVMKLVCEQEDFSTSIVVTWHSTSFGANCVLLVCIARSLLKKVHSNENLNYRPFNKCGFVRFMSKSWRERLGGVSPLFNSSFMESGDLYINSSCILPLLLVGVHLKSLSGESNLKQICNDDWVTTCCVAKSLFAVQVDIIGGFVLWLERGKSESQVRGGVIKVLIRFLSIFQLNFSNHTSLTTTRLCKKQKKICK